MADQKVVRHLPSPLGVDFVIVESKKVTFSFFFMEILHGNFLVTSWIICPSSGTNS